MGDDLLIQKGSGHIFVSTPELRERDDMVPYRPQNLGKKTQEPDKTSKRPTRPRKKVMNTEMEPPAEEKEK